jgi:ribose-phosphate pyrophosphokinase
VIVDDCINGGLTAVEAARFLKEKGAKTVRMMVTHGILAGDAGQKLQESDLDEVIVTDTINTEKKSFPKLRVVSVADIFAKELLDWAK